MKPAEVDALVAQWRDEWELVRLKDVPAWTTHRAHLDKFVEQLDELREALAARPAAPPVGEAERPATPSLWAVEFQPPGQPWYLNEISASKDEAERMLARSQERSRPYAFRLVEYVPAALASPAPQPAAPAPVWHGCKAGGAVCARYKPTGIGCAEGECDLASGVWAAPAPVEPPPASQEALPCKNCRGFDTLCNRCGGSGYVVVARRKAQE